MQTRQIQIIVARDLRHWLARREAAVDLRALEMLATRTRSTHNVGKNMGVLSNCKEKCRSGMADSVSTKAPLLSAYRFAPLSATRSSVVSEEESRAKRGGHFECPCLPEKFRYFGPIAPLISIGPANKSPAIPN